LKLTDDELERAIRCIKKGELPEGGVSAQTILKLIEKKWLDIEHVTIAGDSKELLNIVRQTDIKVGTIKFGLRKKGRTLKKKLDGDKIAALVALSKLRKDLEG